MYSLHTISGIDDRTALNPYVSTRRMEHNCQTGGLEIGTARMVQDTDLGRNG